MESSSFSSTPSIVPNKQHDVISPSPDKLATEVYQESPKTINSQSSLLSEISDKMIEVQQQQNHQLSLSTSPNQKQTSESNTANTTTTTTTASTPNTAPAAPVTYRGVSWNKYHKSWHARIEFNGKREHLGYFATQDGAARAYDTRAIELFGKNAIVNFPQSLTQANISDDGDSETRNDQDESHRSTGAVGNAAPYYCGNRLPRDDAAELRETRKKRKSEISNNNNKPTVNGSLKKRKSSGSPMDNVTPNNKIFTNTAVDLNVDSPSRRILSNFILPKMNMNGNGNSFPTQFPLFPDQSKFVLPTTLQTPASVSSIQPRNAFQPLSYAIPVPLAFAQSMNGQFFANPFCLYPNQLQMQQMILAQQQMPAQSLPIGGQSVKQENPNLY